MLCRFLHLASFDNSRVFFYVKKFSKLVAIICLWFEIRLSCSLFFTGKVTSLVAKKDLPLATRIEEAIRKNESLESLTADNVRRDIARARITEQKGNSAKLIKASSQKNNVTEQKGKSAKLIKTSNQKNNFKATAMKAPSTRTKVVPSGMKSGKASASAKSTKAVKVAKIQKSPNVSKSKKTSPGVKQTGKIHVAAFRGRSSLNKKESLRPS